MARAAGKTRAHVHDTMPVVTHQLNLEGVKPLRIDVDSWVVVGGSESYMRTAQHALHTREACDLTEAKCSLLLALRLHWEGDELVPFSVQHLRNVPDAAVDGELGDVVDEAGGSLEGAGSVEIESHSDLYSNGEGSPGPGARLQLCLNKEAQFCDGLSAEAQSLQTLLLAQVQVRSTVPEHPPAVGSSPTTLGPASQGSSSTP